MLHFTQHYGMWITGFLLVMVGMYEIVKQQEPESEEAKRERMLDLLNEHYAENYADRW